MTFPVAGVEISPLIPIAVALSVSAFTSLGGVAGGLFLIPFQVSVLKFAGPAVNPTNHLFNVLAIPAGVYRYTREGRMLWPLTLTIIGGSIPGVLIGSVIRLWLLPDPQRFKIFIAAVLLLIGSRLAHKVLRLSASVSLSGFPAGNIKLVRWSLRELRYDFDGSQRRVSVPLLVLVTLCIGVIGGTYGLGGGAIIAPVLVSLFNLPVHSIAGAALMGTCATSSFAVVFFSFVPKFFYIASAAPDWRLGGLFGVGGMIGIYCGARLQKRIRPRPIETILAITCLGMAGAYLWPLIAR